MRGGAAGVQVAPPDGDGPLPSPGPPPAPPFSHTDFLEGLQVASFLRTSFPASRSCAPPSLRRLGPGRLRPAGTTQGGLLGCMQGARFGGPMLERFGSQSNCLAFYKRFLESPNFTSWFERRRQAALLWQVPPRPPPRDMRSGVLCR